MNVGADWGERVELGSGRDTLPEASEGGRHPAHIGRRVAAAQRVTWVLENAAVPVEGTGRPREVMRAGRTRRAAGRTDPSSGGRAEEERTRQLPTFPGCTCAKSRPCQLRFLGS